MAKFQVLQNNQRHISLTCGIDYKQKSKSTKSTVNFFTSISVYLILFILVNILISFVVKSYNKSYDFTSRLTAASIVIALCQTITVFINIGVKMQKFAAVNLILQTIVDGEGDCALFLNYNIRFIKIIKVIF